jgi:hypothetical protein
MNCKPGDLALVIRAELPENIGIVVEVVERCELFGEGYWLCRARTPRATLNGFGHVVVADSGSVPDSWLRPISGVPVAEEIIDEVTA